MTSKQIALLFVFLGANLLAIGIFDKYIVDLWGCAICCALAMTELLGHARKR
ncbi:MAG: hypothetical protein H0V70_23605 [Ktedonobacteraceae bacterium]|nr:hypothetical protein [Ktedonobacteraceae bacterium]